MNTDMKWHDSNVNALGESLLATSNRLANELMDPHIPAFTEEKWKLGIDAMYAPCIVHSTIIMLIQQGETRCSRAYFFKALKNQTEQTNSYRENQ